MPKPDQNINAELRTERKRKFKQKWPTKLQRPGETPHPHDFTSFTMTMKTVTKNVIIYNNLWLYGNSDICQNNRKITFWPYRAALDWTLRCTYLTFNLVTGRLGAVWCWAGHVKWIFNSLFSENDSTRAEKGNQNSKIVSGWMNKSAETHYKAPESCWFRW